MSRREIIAYAITHAPPGVKGGPYAGNESTDHQVPSLALARRYSLDELYAAQADVAWLVRNEYTARVIRIVRARPSPSEASAVVLRELVAIDDALNEGRDPPCSRAALAARARRVLAAAGPDPMPVVRAAMVRRDARAAHAREDASPAPRRQARLADAWRVFADAERAEDAAVDTYRKAGGK